jgi:alpha-ribazole phosphatase
VEIYLIRHTTPQVRAGQIYGWSEIPLSHTYAEEIELVKQQIPEHFDKVYSSPSLRCTALAEKIKVDFTVDERLRELNFGDWEGKTWDTVDQTALQEWMNDFVRVRVPGGESMQEMKSRLLLFWDELMEKDLDQLAIVTHAGAIRILLAQYRAMELADSFNIQVAYGAVFRVAVDR